MIIAAMAAGQNADALAHAILEAHWRDDADHADPATLAALATAHGYDADTLLSRARDADMQATFQANTLLYAHIFHSFSLARFFGV